MMVEISNNNKLVNLFKNDNSTKNVTEFLSLTALSMLIASYIGGYLL